MDNRRLARLLRWFVASIVALAILLSSVIFIGSWQLAQIDRKNQDTAIAIMDRITKLEKATLTYDDVQTIVAALPKPKDGVNGTNGVNGANGTDGKDSVSTNTVVENTTTIIKEVPVNGEDGQTPLIALTVDGTWLYKMPNDRTWIPVPIINLEVAR